MGTPRKLLSHWVALEILLVCLFSSFSFADYNCVESISSYDCSNNSTKRNCNFQGGNFYNPVGSYVYECTQKTVQPCPTCGVQQQYCARTIYYCYSGTTELANKLTCELEGGTWKDGSCKTAPEITYRCQNRGGSGSPSNLGTPPQADFYQCEDDVCTLTKTLSGTCQDWGVCPQGVSDCDMSDSTGKVPCALAGNGTSTNGRCYYQCGNGKTYNCPSSYSTWGGSGDVYVGYCDSYPSESCAPDLKRDTTQRRNPYTTENFIVVDSSSGKVDIEDPSFDGSNYAGILQSIHDTLHVANDIGRAETWYLGSIDSSISVQNYLMQNMYNQIRQSLDLVQDIDSQFRQGLTLNYADSPMVKIDGFSEVVETIRQWYGKYNIDSAKVKRCSEYSEEYSRCRSMGFDTCRYNPPVECYSGGSPLETMWGVEVALIGSLVDYLTTNHSDPELINPDNVIKDNVTPKDSLDEMDEQDTSGLSDIEKTIKRLTDKADSTRSALENGNKAEINPDDLWIDSSKAADAVARFQVDGTILEECFVCSANLGNLGGLLDDDIQFRIDFGDLGGYNWCALFRAIVKIMTIVICVSLTLGSWYKGFKG